MNRSRRLLNLALILLFCILAFIWISVTRSPRDLHRARVQALAPRLQHTARRAYAGVLKKYVTPGGLVDYPELKKNRPPLDAYVDSAARLKPEVLANYSDSEQIAFWLNVYNALTLQVVIDHYPLTRRSPLGFAFPENSIRQIPGVWDKIQFTVIGKPMTLNDIEHEVLRKKFNDARIHMALVCASRGCPPLRNEPFDAAHLRRQFEEQTAQFLEQPENFSLDPGQKILRLSSIFKWFGSDFSPQYGRGPFTQIYGKQESAVLNFIRRYRDIPVPGNSSPPLQIIYSDYDWSLNEFTPSAQAGADA